MLSNSLKSRLSTATDYERQMYDLAKEWFEEHENEWLDDKFRVIHGDGKFASAIMFIFKEEKLERKRYIIIEAEQFNYTEFMES